MPSRVDLGITVFDAAINRLVEIYEAGHRLVVSISGGKDSTCCLELAVIAATMTGRLPVEAITRDEEILYPGSYEYIESLAARDDINLTWLVANQAIINVFNRSQPYWWVFDPQLPPEQWVRRPPSWATYITEQTIMEMTTRDRYPVDEQAGQRLISVVGLRVQESRNRMYGLHSSGGHLTRPIRTGVAVSRPIYDWTDGDVWKAIRDQGWVYNTAYDVMHRHGFHRHKLRIGPPSMSPAGASALGFAATAWPNWFDRVCARLPGMRAVAQYGKRVLEPVRHRGETWKETFYRECVEEAPGWIRERAVKYSQMILNRHSRHSSGDLPDVVVCRSCQGTSGSWKALALALYNGDPFSMKCDALPYLEPHVFRDGAPAWGGKPTF